MNLKILLTILIVLTVTLISCKKDVSDGKNSLVEMIVEPKGENCVSGGFKIFTGIDLNENGILDETEIENEEYICNGSNGNDGNNGSDGNNSLINVFSEPNGVYCSFGGVKIETGLDANQNGFLDEEEVQSINYICNGENGQAGSSVSTIRIPFSLAYKWRTCGLGWQSEIEDGLIYNFNISDYQNFDSVIFVAQFHRSPAETVDTLWLRLFDYTGSKGLSNSELYSSLPNLELNDPDKRIFKSNNFKNSILPDPRTIGIQFKRQEQENRSISIHNAEIILYKIME